MNSNTNNGLPFVFWNTISVNDLQRRGYRHKASDIILLRFSMSNPFSDWNVANPQLLHELDNDMTHLNFVVSVGAHEKNATAQRVRQDSVNQVEGCAISPLYVVQNDLFAMITSKKRLITCQFSLKIRRDNNIVIATQLTIIG